MGVVSHLTASRRRNWESGHSFGNLQRHTGSRIYGEPASDWLIMGYVRGAPVRLLERIPGRRAESLDCVVYGIDMRGLVTTNLDRREEEVASATMPKKAPVVVRSALLNR